MTEAISHRLPSWINCGSREKRDLKGSFSRLPHTAQVEVVVLLFEDQTSVAWKSPYLGFHPLHLSIWIHTEHLYLPTINQHLHTLMRIAQGTVLFNLPYLPVRTTCPANSIIQTSEALFPSNKYISWPATFSLNLFPPEQPPRSIRFFLPWIEILLLE